MAGQPHVVVGVDGSDLADEAVHWAAQDAALRGCELTIAHATSPVIGSWLATPVPANVLDWQQQAGRDILDRAAAIAHDAAGEAVRVTTEQMSSSPAAALVALSEGAELVVVGSRGRSAVARAVLGSVSMGLLHHAHCPVTVIHERPASPRPAGQQDAPILLGVDGSAASELATELAFGEASRRGVGLIALHAWWSPGSFEFADSDWDAVRQEVERTFDEQLAPWRERHPLVGVQTVVVRDEPAREIVDRSDDAQLVVVGSRGHGAVASTLLGSVSVAVVQAVRTPVLVARS